MENKEEILINSLKSVLPKENSKSLTLDSDLLEDLGMDSIQAVTLSIQLEKKTGINILEDYADIKTVRDTLNILESNNI